MSAAISQWPRDSYLLGCAVRFWGRMGYKQKEVECLKALRQTGHQSAYFAAATAFHRMSGNWPKALKLCRKWLGEEPGNMFARREFADLFAMAKGMKAALALSRKWMRKHRGNDDYEMLYLDYLKSLLEYDAQLEVLKARLKRNAYDTWAWRELGFSLIQVIDLGDGRDDAAVRRELGQTIAKCKKLSPEEASTLVLEADWAAYEGDYETAIGLYKNAVVQDPEYLYAYRQAWHYGSKLPEDARKTLFAELEKAMIKTTGFLIISKELAEMAAECFGSAQAHRIVDRWLKCYPRDPEVTKAKANLLLHYGQGRTDAEKAAAMLEDEILRFPNKADFRFILSRAYRTLQDEQKWIGISKAILQQFPLSNIQRRQLAEFYRLKNDLQRATALLKEGILLLPLDGWVRLDLVDLYFHDEKKEDALSLVVDRNGQKLEAGKKHSSKSSSSNGGRSRLCL
jgi:tetratricopeptide (TPR) repeat protein